MAGEPTPGPGGRAAHGPVVTAFVLTVPTVDLELAADRLWQLGVRAVEEREPASADGVEPAAIGEPVIELWTSLGDDPHAASNERLRLEAGWSWRTEPVDATSADTWRDFAEPMVAADRVVVVPAWQEPPAENGHLLPILIEPGGAFGLGDHPTTALSLAALIAELDAHTERFVLQAEAPSASCPSPSVLDVGCGTGLLAVGAALLGASPVRAVDVAAAAVEATTDNAIRNGVGNIVTVDGASCAELDGTYDVVVANILAPVLISLAPDLARLTARQGRLIISGVLVSRYDHVVEALSPMVVEQVAESGGWAAVTLRHPDVTG